VNREGASEMTATAVYIIDDDAEVRTAASFLVKAMGHHNHPFATGTDFLDALPYLDPGCMLVDLQMEDIAGIDLIRATTPVRAAFPVVVMTAHADVENTVAAMKAGAFDVLQKPVSAARLAEALMLARQSLDPPPQPTLDDSIPALARQYRLTDRQTQVLRGLVALGSNKKIAADLQISIRTVEMHRAAVMSKLDVRSLPALLRLLVAATIRPQPVQPFLARAAA
jgi:two-component system, LuxR family, response regulator FixJ